MPRPLASQAVTRARGTTPGPCQLRRSRSLCLCSHPVMKQSDEGSCESPSTDPVVQDKLPHLS